MVWNLRWPWSSRASDAAAAVDGYGWPGVGPWVFGNDWVAAAVRGEVGRRYEDVTAEQLGADEASDLPVHEEPEADQPGEEDGYVAAMDAAEAEDEAGVAAGRYEDIDQMWLGPGLPELPDLDTTAEDVDTTH